MAETQQDRRLKLVTPLGEDVLMITRFTGEEELSRGFRYELDLASTNGVRPAGQSEGPSHPVVRMTADDPCMLGHFELSWQPNERPTIH